MTVIKNINYGVPNVKSEYLSIKLMRIIKKNIILFAKLRHNSHVTQKNVQI